jgi:hypothetical protein
MLPNDFLLDLWNSPYDDSKSLRQLVRYNNGEQEVISVPVIGATNYTPFIYSDKLVNLKSSYHKGDNLWQDSMRASWHDDAISLYLGIDPKYEMVNTLFNSEKNH